MEKAMKKFKDLELEEQLELCRAVLCGETIEQWLPDGSPQAGTQRGHWARFHHTTGRELSLYGAHIYRVKREPEHVYAVTLRPGKVVPTLSREDAERICRNSGLDESAIKTFREVIE